jgi:hypothetical protein
MCNLLNSPTTNQVKAVVPPNLAKTGNIPVNICYGVLTDPVQYGVTDRPVTLAIEVVAYRQTDGKSVAPLNQSIEICLQGTGSLLYRDATGQPRVLTTLKSFSDGGYTCGNIPNAGTVILVAGPAAPAGNSDQILPAAHTLTACTITTNGILNLHSAPNAESSVATLVPNETTLTATARAGDYIQVVYGDSQGWLAVRYLALDGNCE